VSPAGLRGQALRFLFVGGINTIATYGIFIGLGLLIPAWIAYSIAFALGLVWVVLGSSRFVFRSATSVKQIALFSAWYLLVYGVGRIVVHFLEPKGFLDLAITSFAVLVATTPLSFLGGRLIFARERKTTE
jgi:putative flippase GtrA